MGKFNNRGGAMTAEEFKAGHEYAYRVEDGDALVMLRVREVARDRVGISLQLSVIEGVSLWLENGNIRCRVLNSGEKMLVREHWPARELVGGTVRTMIDTVKSYNDSFEALREALESYM